MNSDTKHDTNQYQNLQHSRAELTMDKEQAHIILSPTKPSPFNYNRNTPHVYYVKRM
jgi:hypothetical protein